MSLTKIIKSDIDTDTCNVPEIWLQSQEQLRAFIYRRLKDNDQTNDILQDVLLKLYRLCNAEKGIRNVQAWLFAVARNAVIDYQRAQQKLTYEIIDDITEDGENLYKDAAAFILPMIDFLPQKYALPLRLSDIEKMKQQDIARQLNISLTAAKSRVQRARALLKNEFFTCFNLELDQRGSLVDFKLKPQCLPLQHIRCCEK